MQERNIGPSRKDASTAARPPVSSPARTLSAAATGAAISRQSGAFDILQHSELLCKIWFQRREAFPSKLRPISISSPKWLSLRSFFALARDLLQAQTELPREPQALGKECQMPRPVPITAEDKHDLRSRSRLDARRGCSRTSLIAELDGESANLGHAVATGDTPARSEVHHYDRQYRQ